MASGIGKIINIAFVESRKGAMHIDPLRPIYVYDVSVGDSLEHPVLRDPEISSVSGFWGVRD